MKCKRFISVVLALGLVFSLSVNSFALSYRKTDFLQISTIKNGNTHLGTIFTSEIPEADRPFFDELMASGQYSLFYGFPSNDNVSDSTLYIVSTPVGTDISTFFVTSNQGWDLVSFTYPNGFRPKFAFKYNSDGFHYNSIDSSHAPFDSLSPFSLVAYLLSPAPGVTYSSFKPAYQLMESVTGNLILDFDNPTVDAHSLTIDYKYEDGTTAAESHVESLAKDTSYSVVSPSVAGFVPSLDLVSGTMPDENLTVTVTYMPSAPPLSEHTLTIHYVHEGGGQAVDSVVRTYPYTSPYSIASPSLPGYTADVRTVTGRMPDEDVTITVTYSPTSSSGGGSGGGGDWIFSNPFTKPGVFPSFDFSNPFTKPGSQSFQFSNPFLNPYK